MTNSDHADFSVLAVCTGNICRSPALERWLRAGFGPDSGIVVTSAGIRAVVGAPVSEPMAPLIAQGGGDPTGFAARQLTTTMVRDADLVLTAARGHRAAVVEASPAAVRRVFTVREFARLVRLVEPDELESVAPRSAGAAARLAALVNLAARRRGQVRVPEAEDDVIDPIGQSGEVYLTAAGQMWPAVQAIVAAVEGEPPPPPAGEVDTRRRRRGRRAR